VCIRFFLARSIGVDGFLTDQEVFEALNSPNFATVMPLKTHEAKAQELHQKTEGIKRTLRGAPPRPGARPPRRISEAERRVLEAELVHYTRLQQRVARGEDIAWVRTQTLEYLATCAGSTQKAEHVRTFFTRLAALQREHGFELMPHEALQLVNLRPTTSVEMHCIIEQCSEVRFVSLFYDFFHLYHLRSHSLYFLFMWPPSQRLRTDAAREALEALITEVLPEAPVREDPNAAQDEDEEEGKEGAAAGGEQEEENDEDAIAAMAGSEEQQRAMRDEDEFTSDAKAQVDTEVEGNAGGGGEEDDVPRTANRGWRK
jgi:hypothetical protein